MLSECSQMPLCCLYVHKCLHVSVCSQTPSYGCMCVHKMPSCLTATLLSVCSQTPSYIACVFTYVVCVFTDAFICCLCVHRCLHMLSVCSQTPSYVVCVFTDAFLCVCLHMLSVCSQMPSYVVCVFTDAFMLSHLTLDMSAPHYAEEAQHVRFSVTVQNMRSLPLPRPSSGTPNYSLKVRGRSLQYFTLMWNFIAYVLQSLLK